MWQQHVQEPCENMGLLLGQRLFYEPALLEMHDLCRYSDSTEWIAPPLPLSSSDELTEFLFGRCVTVLASVGCENGCMNLASTLKSEISRVARKELRAEFQSLKQTTAKLRSDNAELKRRLSEIEKLIKQLSKGSSKKAPVSNEEGAAVTRFSCKGLAAQRKRLELSAADFGFLLGVSGASVYLWEKGETRPRPSQMPAIAAVRKMGKKDVAQMLAERPNT